MKTRLKFFPVSIAAVGALAALSSPLAHGAPATWNAIPTDGNWEVVTSENNWSTDSTTPGSYPGMLAASPGSYGNTNTDTATFDASSVTAINVASALNIDNITFGTGTANSASAYTISGAALDVTNGGAITMSSGAGASETINNNLVIEPGSSTTGGTLFLNNAITSGTSNIMTIAGNISGDASNPTTAVDTLGLNTTTGFTALAGTGANVITGTLSSAGTGGLAVYQDGGSWTLGGTGTSTIANGNLQVKGGTLSFGSGGTGPTMTISNTSGINSGAVLYVNGGTFDMAGGSLTASSTSGASEGLYLAVGGANISGGTLNINANQGIVLGGADTYNQTGGTVTTSGYLEGANNATGSIINISGGTLTLTGTSHNELALEGATTVNLNGTGVFTAPNLDMTTTQHTTTPAGSTFNLGNGTNGGGTGGGTLITNDVIPGDGSGNTIFNFNGGLLQSSGSSTTYLQGLTTAEIGAGGAFINTEGFNDTIAQNLVSNATTDGGLTKLGTGNLILNGTNTYNGGTVINGGLVGINSDASLGADPSSAAINIQFTGATGTLQDTTNNVSLNANRTIQIANGSTATFDTSTNVFTINGGVKLTSGSAETTIALVGSTAGAGDLAGTVSDTGSTGGLVLAESGGGSWTFGGNGASTLAKGEITVAGGTFNFGSATETPSLTISATPTVDSGGVGVYIGTTGGAATFDMNAGTLSVNAGQGLVLNGVGDAYNQTGGTFTTTGLIEFSNAGASATSTVNISGGALTTTKSGTADSIDLAVRGTSITTLSGTGILTTPVLNMTTSQIGSGSATSTFNLGNGTAGGTLVTGQILQGTGGSTGTQTFNFNGGTLQSSASSTTFMAGGSTSTFNVDAGGAIINTEGFNDTIGQGLVHGNGGSADGGLTKNGTGTLTLSGANTYNGNTTINSGTVAMASGSSLASQTIVDNSTVATTGGFNVASLTGGFTIASSQKLAGNGNVTGQINTVSGSMINPGTLTTPGTLTLNSGLNVTTSGLDLTFRLDNTSNSDELVLGGGAFTESAGTIINLLNGGTFAGAGTYSILDASQIGAGNVTLADYTLGTTIAGYTETLVVNGADDILEVQVAAAPEPSTYVMLLGGLALLVGIGKLRRRGVNID